MKDINDFLPKLPKNTWGGLFNFKPSTAKTRHLQTKAPFGYDEKWHTILKQGDTMNIDGIDIVKKTADSMT